MRFYKFGVTVHDAERAEPGFTLFSPLIQKATYLIDMSGHVVHHWDLPAQPGNYAHLLPNGNLLVATKTPGGPHWFGAKGGLIQEIDWDGNLVWQHADDNQHHDFRRLDNENTIYVAWEVLPEAAQKRVQGGRPGTEHEGQIWGDCIFEVTPAGQIAWECISPYFVSSPGPEFQSNSVFRAYRYAADGPEIRGRLDAALK